MVGDGFASPVNVPPLAGPTTCLTAGKGCFQVNVFPKAPGLALILNRTRIVAHAIEQSIEPKPTAQSS